METSTSANQTAFPDIRKEHAIETYKSLIQISLEGMKLLAVLNGGAAVALLAYLGNIAGRGPAMPDMRYPMSFFLGGLVLCGLCFVASYLTQLTLYNQSVLKPADRFYKRHQFWLWGAMLCVVVSILAFSGGAYTAVIRFR